MRSVLFLVYCLVMFSTDLMVRGYNVCDHLDKDLVFIMDGSESISESDFRKANKAIMDMMQPINSLGKKNRLSYMLFGNDADIIFNLDNKLKKNDIYTLINNAQNKHSATGIGRALNETLEKIVPISRKKADKLVMLFTDGTNNMFPSPFSYAEDIKKAGFKIVTVGIGARINKKELDRIASPGSSYHIHDFNSIMPTLIKIMDHLCPIPQPTPPPPCGLDKVDYVIVQDCSRSLDNYSYRVSKKMAFNIFSHRKIDGEHYRYAFVQFSDKPKLVFNLNRYKSKRATWRKIRRSRRFGDATGIGKALELVEKEVLPKKRPGVPFVIVLSTDGKNNIYPRPQEIAERLKKAGAFIVGIGVNFRVDVPELKEISSDGLYFTLTALRSNRSRRHMRARSEMLRNMICQKFHK